MGGSDLIKIMLIGFLVLALPLAVAVSAIAVLVAILVSGIVSNAHGTPYVPIKRKYIRPILLWADLSANDIFYDLGCGDARVLISAVKDFGIKKATGFEVAPWSYLEARFVLGFSTTTNRIRIIRRNFFKANLSDASFIYAYLFPKPIDRLAYKLEKELVIGSKILCPSFPIDLVRHPEFKLLKSAKFDKITAYLYEKL